MKPQGFPRPIRTKTKGKCPKDKGGLALTQSERATLVDYALSLINQARTDAGVNELTLDDNPVAQSHAENSRDACTRGHWGPDGMKPYMRYTIAGGEQYSSENVFAIDFCPEDLDNYDLETPREQIDFAMDRFLNSPGHRQNILDPNHRKVGIGLTYRAPTIWFVQLFVGDYIEYQDQTEDRLRHPDPQRSNQKRCACFQRYGNHSHLLRPAPGTLESRPTISNLLLLQRTRHSRHPAASGTRWLVVRRR